MELSVTEENKIVEKKLEQLESVLREENDIFDSDNSSEYGEDEADEELVIDTSNFNHSDRSLSLSGNSSSVALDNRNDEDLGPEENVSLGFLLEPSDVDRKTLAEQALFLNRKLQETFMGHINKIKELLRVNALKMDQLNEMPDEPKKQTYCTYFRAPYFRKGSSVPEPNEDAKVKRLSKDYDIIMTESIKDPRFFFRRKHSRHILIKAVIENSKELLLAPLLTKMEYDLERKNTCAKEIEELESKNALDYETLEVAKSTENKKQIKEREKRIKQREAELEKKSQELAEYKTAVAQWEEEIKKKSQIPDQEILATLDTKKIDWMKIAKMNFKGNTSWIDCQKAWENQVCPNLNLKTWSDQEESKLKQLVSKHPVGEWQKIAAALGAGRTAWQCFTHYQRNFNKQLTSRPWTKEEDQKLIKVTQVIKDGLGHYSWSHVGSLMDSRSPKECMIRFGRINPTQNHGKWTQMEDAKLIASHQIFGPTWCRISKYVGTRNAIQCRDRFLNCLDPALNFEKFTYDDDVVLLKLHKKMGPAWAKMLPHFKGRTDNMLLSRYTTLKRWKKKAEWFESQSNETKNMLLGRSLKKEERNELMQRTEAYFKKHLNVDKADYERQQRDRENNVDPDLIPPRPPLHFKYTHRLGLDKSGSYWSQRLNFYKHLSDNLKKSLEKSMSATLKNPSSSKLHAHMAKDIMDEAVQETMQETESEPKIKPKVQKVQRVLNKIFLRECDLRVQDMVKLTQELQCKNKGRIRHLDIDEQLRSLLATKKRLRKRKGRSRHYFNKEPSCVQEADAEDLKHTVPCIMMKSLGTDVNRLYTQTRWKGLECMDSIRNQKKFENDPEYISEIAKLTEAFSDTSPMGGDGDNLAQLKKGLSEKKMKAIKQIFSEKYQEIRNDLEGALSSISCDMGLLSSLKDKHNVAEAEQYPQILFAKATTDACKSSDSETESSVADSQIGAEKLPPAVRRLACSLPISTSLRREDRRLSRSQGATTPSKLEFEKLKLMTSEEIAQEKSNMPEVKSLAVEDLPPLPPNTSTVRCLKVLLWKEKDLIKTASPLCKPVKTQENSLPTEGVSHSTSTQRNDDNMDVDSIDDCELVEHQHPYHIQPVDTADINFGTSPATASAEPSFSSATDKLALENPPDYMPVTTISEIKVETRLLDNGSIEVLMPPYSSKTKNETKQDDSKKSIPSRTISDIKVFKVISGASLQRSQLDPQGLQSQAVHDRASEASKNTTTSESDNLKSSPMIFKSFDKEILPLTAEGENLINKIRQQDEYKTLLARFKALFTWPTLLSTTQTSNGVGSELSTKINDYVLRMLEKKLEQKGLKQETNESSTTQNDGVAESAVSDQPDLSLSESSSAQPIKKRGRPPGTGKPRGSKLQRLDSKEPGTTDGDANAASQSAVENETVSVDKTEEKPKRRVGRPKGSKKVNKDPIVERPKRNTQPLITDETEEEQVGAGRRPQWWKEALIAAMMAKRGIELGKEQDQPVDIAEDMDFQDQGNYSDDDWAVQSKLEMTRKRRRSGRFSKGTLATKTKTN